MNEILKRISALGIIPVIKIDDVEKAVPLAKALCDGGLPCAEVTFRTANAEESIRRITSALPNMLVGAGTVLTTEQVDKAIAAGASFIVSPGLNPKVVRHCIEKNIIITPGCSNPSDIEQAIDLGLDVVKFFPAEAAGGLAMIKAICAPYTTMKFIPTGGINAKNLNEYLSFNKIIACGGSWMVSEDLINGGEFDKITALTKEAISTMLGFELAHVGVNAKDEQEAQETAMLFSKAFGLEYRPGGRSIFAGGAVEVMKSPYLGKNGHLAMRTNSVQRAMHYLEAQGLSFNMDTAQRDEKGTIQAIYLNGEMGGFAVHLLQKK
jgi:2-dehydro-3-deoxyphosphogluconate aldolase/(4S)-4-hydroxy-2-oxoglutarate aldolase